MNRTRVALPLALFATLVVALLPADWRLGWSRDAAEIVRFPLRPFSHAGGVLAAWLRPTPSPGAGLPAEAKALVEQLVQDRDVARRLYHREHQRVLELEEQLAQLQMLRARVPQLSSRSVIAHVTSRNPESPVGLVELGVDRGVSTIVRPGTVAVYGGVHLLGSTVGEAKRNACTLCPITNATAGPIQARVFPREDPNLAVERAPLVLLEQTGAGTFVAEVRRTAIIEPGDVVRLDDQKWPGSAQMMVVGTVGAVNDSEEEPLRHRITVRPAYHMHQISYATLIIEEVAAGSETALGEGDRP